MKVFSNTALTTVLLTKCLYNTEGLSPYIPQISRRAAIGWIAGASTAGFLHQNPAFAEGQLEHVDADKYLRYGRVSSPMGISGQGTRSRPQTGVVLRDGSEPSRDARTGDVSAEVLVKSESGTQLPIIVSFQAEEWPLATGPFYDLECRDPKTGDGAFLAVTPSTDVKSVSELKDSFIVNSVFGPMGRFSAFGEPTDIRIHDSQTQGDYRTIDVSFSTLSQGTQAEVPRHAKLFATLPEGASQALVLVGSSAASRWEKRSSSLVARVGDSFRAVPAPRTEMKMRAKPRRTLTI